MSRITGGNDNKNICWYVFCFLGLFVLNACSLVYDFEECKKDSDCSDSTQVCTEGYCITEVVVDDKSSSSWTPSTECTSVYGLTEDEVYDEDTFVLGSVLPYTGDLSSYGPKIGEGVKLAVDEINQGGGILGSKLGVIFCDSGTDTETAAKAVEHLAAIGRVPAIIGPAASSIVISVFNEVAKDEDMVIMSPAATSPVITTIDDNNLLWRTVPSDARQGAAIANFLLEEQAFERIAIVNRDDAYGNGLRDAITDILCETFSCTDSDQFFTKSYSEDHATDEQSSIITDLTAFDPDITVLISFFDDGQGFLSFASTNGLERFVLADSLKTTKLMTDLTLSDAMLCQIVGTIPASPSGTNYKSFSLRFTSKYGEMGSYAVNAYDALYLLAYAIAATGSASPTGSQVAAGLGRLSSGEIVKTGVSSMSEALQMLYNNPQSTIDYDGASGALDFNEYGEAPADIEGWALDLTDESITSLGVVYTAEGEYTDLYDDISGIGSACDEMRTSEAEE